MKIRFQEIKPSPDLSPYVACFWEGQFNLGDAHPLEFRVVPNGLVELIIHLSEDHCALPSGHAFSTSSDYTLIGMHMQPYLVKFDRRVNVFGIRLKPEGFRSLLGIPSAEIFQGITDLETLGGRKLREFLDRVRTYSDIPSMVSASEAYLLGLLGDRRPEIPYLSEALRLIRLTNGNLSIKSLAEQVYISPRQLERSFKQQLGLSPKRYMRIARLNAVNRQLEKGRILNLAQLAYRHGYTDQAHFIRDFRTFTGTAPGIFLKNRKAYIVNPLRIAV